MNDNNVFALFNVVGTKNNLAIRDLVNRQCVPDLFVGERRDAVGQPRVPVDDRLASWCRTRSR